MNNNIPNGKFSITKVQDPTPPIGGTYKLFYNDEPVEVWRDGWTTDIPHDTNAETLAYGIGKIA